MANTHVAIIIQEKRQAHPFIAQGAEYQDVFAADLICPIGNRSQVAAFSKRANPPALALEPKAI